MPQQNGSAKLTLKQILFGVSGRPKPDPIDKLVYNEIEKTGRIGITQDQIAARLLGRKLTKEEEALCILVEEQTRRHMTLTPQLADHLDELLANSIKSTRDAVTKYLQPGRPEWDDAETWLASFVCRRLDEMDINELDTTDFVTKPTPEDLEACAKHWALLEKHAVHFVAEELGFDGNKVMELVWEHYRLDDRSRVSIARARGWV